VKIHGAKRCSVIVVAIVCATALAQVHHSEFVREHLGEWPGPFIDEDTNEVLGYHQGEHDASQCTCFRVQATRGIIIRCLLIMRLMWCSSHAAGIIVLVLTSYIQ
jgi:hypothetical protein